MPIDLNDAGPQVIGPALAVEYWGGQGWVIVDNNAHIDVDEDGNPNYWDRLYAHGFDDERIARRWMMVFNATLAAGGRPSGRQDYRALNDTSKSAH
jgi:hypothetical protein